MKYPWLLLVFFLTSCSKVDTQPLQQWQHVAQGSYSAALSTNGRFSAVSSIQDGVAYWDIHNNALLYYWRHQEDSDNLVFNLAISDDNSHVFTADSNTYALWRTNDGANVGFWQLDNATVRDIAVSNAGRHLLIGKSDGAVQHITLQEGRRLEFLGHTERINSVDMSPNGRYALSGSNDYTAQLWDTQTAQVLYSFPHPSRVTKVALDPQGRYAFTADSQNLAQIWDIQTGARISQLQFSARQQVFSAVRFSADGKYLLTGAPTRNLALWDVATGKQLQRWRVSPRTGSRPPSAVVHAVAFDGTERIISESSSGFAEVWEINYE
ncbi:WD40 repeat domain-containing protein [Arsukibacterium sp.]|uniref:WD40 repeat domain-containing protein n=1 Tax=Arsukibacterium sp. TaxID=1977258 RepID=UPI002FD98402